MENMENEMYEDLYTLVNEDGEEGVFELIDRIEEDGVKYFALAPFYENPEEIPEESDPLIILKGDVVDGEDVLVPIDNEEDFNKVAEIFMTRLEDEIDFEVEK